MAKILGILTAVILAISALIAIKNNTRFEKEIEAEAAISRDLKKTQKNFEEAAEILKALPDEIAGVEANTLEVQGLVADMKEKLVELKSELATKGAKIKANEAELSQTTATLADAGDLQKLAAQMKVLNVTSEELAQTIAGREAELASFASRATENEEETESLRQMVASMGRGASDPSLKTRIRSIYPNWGFVTLSDGAVSGVVGGSKLDVVRNDEVVAKLLVTTVVQNSSCASIIPDSVGDGVNLMIGDRVVVSSGEAVGTNAN